MKNRMFTDRLIRHLKSKRCVLRRINKRLELRIGDPEKLPVSRRYDWWNDKKFVAEMNAEYEAIERGEAKAYTMEEVMQRLAEKRIEHRTNANSGALM